MAGAALRCLRAFTSGGPGKQGKKQGACKQETKANESSCVGAGISILQGIPWFCNGLLSSAGSKPTSFGISYETKLEKDEQIL